MKLAKYIVIPIIAGVSFGVICDEIKKSDLVKKIVEREYDKLNDKTFRKINHYVTGSRKIFVQEGTGYLEIIQKDLQTNNRFKNLKEKNNWKMYSLVDFYRIFNGGDLKYPKENTLPAW